MADYVSYDLGMLSRYQYYTGIIFKAYTYGTGDYIVTGGRYNKLLVQFGKRYPGSWFCHCGRPAYGSFIQTAHPYSGAVSEYSDPL